MCVCGGGVLYMWAVSIYMWGGVYVGCESMYVGGVYVEFMCMCGMCMCICGGYVYVMCVCVCVFEYRRGEL